MAFWNRQKKDQPIPEPPAKRISTPAGQRLSVILENGEAQNTRDKHRASVRRSALSAQLADVPRESMEGRSNDSSGYSYSVWSDGEKFAILRNNKQIAKRGGWKRLAMIIAIVISLIIALAVGLAIGLKKKDSKSSSSDAHSAAAATATDGASSPTATASLSASAVPSSFPLGNYSMVTFLDTVQTNCTANAATWTCYPYTIYNTSPSKSVATFNWIITSPTSGKYQISSTDNPFSISFTNTNMELLDQGQSTERYHFQLQQTKTVSPSSSLTSDNAAVSCDYDNTSLQVALYTKMASTYPNTSKGDPSGSPSYTVWPYAVRIEQSVGGGQNVPSCHKVVNGNNGDAVTDGLTAQDASSLCSCLYKNWRTPT